MSTLNEDGTPATRYSLVEENSRLRDSLLRCNKAVLEIQKNADLKVVRLEWEVVRLRQQLADEAAVNSKYVCLNQSLRRQLQHVADQIVKDKSIGPAFRQRHEELRDLQQREAVVERHLNELIQSRNQTFRDNTALKKLLLSTCFECRQRLPVKRRMTEPHIVPDNPNNGNESSPQRPQQALSRPTYHTSARNVLDNLPKQPVAPNFQTPKRYEPSSPLVRPKKSCLKIGPSNPPTPTKTNSKSIVHSNDHSPRTTTALIMEAQSSSTRKSLMAPRLITSERPLNSFRLYENRRNHVADSAATSSPSSQRQQQQQRATPGTRFRRRALDAVAEPKTRRASTGTLVISRRPSLSKRIASASGKWSPLRGTSFRRKDKEQAETTSRQSQESWVATGSHSHETRAHTIKKPPRRRHSVASHRIEC